jgi:hypothetical protein
MQACRTIPLGCGCGSRQPNSAMISKLLRLHRAGTLGLSIKGQVGPWHPIWANELEWRTLFTTGGRTLLSTEARRCI